MDYTATATATGSVGEEFVGKMSAEVESLVVIMTLSLSLSLSLHNNYQSFRQQPGTPTHASSELRELGEFKQNFP